MSLTAAIAVVFAILLGLEWHYRFRSLRLAAALMALVVWMSLQPLPTRAARRALAMPDSQRVTQRSNGDPLSGYDSGVRTMEQAVAEDIALEANERLLAVAVLLWLACSPVIRRAHERPIRTE